MGHTITLHFTSLGCPELGGEMVLWNNRSGVLSKVTSYQSQSVCFSLFFLKSIFISACSPCSISPSHWLWHSSSCLVLHGQTCQRRGREAVPLFPGCNYRLRPEHGFRSSYHYISYSPSLCRNYRSVHRQGNRGPKQHTGKKTEKCPI